MDDRILLYVVLALCAAVVVLIVAFIRMKREFLRRMVEFEQYRRRQHADLAASVDRSNERAARDIQALSGSLLSSARVNEERVDKLIERINASLDQQQAQNERLRESMDRRLRETLETRLGQSFKQVSEQLERVYKGLGEMQHLASGVGDLKKVLSGIKTRGVWGEVRLGALLAQNLSPGQYVENTPVEAGGTERVEYAIRLPGKREGEPVLLPVDAKFPQEDYQRLIDASEAGDKAACEKASLQLERALLEEAKRISSKYIRVPHTTDFAVMFLPVEGLYAEALRRPGLSDKMQEKYRVLLAGPTTISALLTSLQMGFRSLAVEERSEEIWRLLGSVREEFLRFGESLDRTRQRLNQAGEELDAAATRTRKITRELRRAEELPIPENWKS